MNRVIYLHTNGSKKLKLQMMLWRKFTGETITLPIKEAVRQAIITESLKKTKLKVCIGTDSQVKANVTEFATVIVFLREHNGGFMYIHNDIKYGQAFNRYRAYNMCDDNEYCIMLDGDDWLPHNYVLRYLSIFIKMYDIDLTYGKFEWFLDNKIEKYNKSK